MVLIRSNPVGKRIDNTAKMFFRLYEGPYVLQTRWGVQTFIVYDTERKKEIGKYHASSMRKYFQQKKYWWSIINSLNAGTHIEREESRVREILTALHNTTTIQTITGCMYCVYRGKEFVARHHGFVSYIPIKNIYFYKVFTSFYKLDYIFF